jgi:hypothetical protein
MFRLLPLRVECRIRQHRSCHLPRYPPKGFFVRPGRALRRAVLARDRACWFAGDGKSGGAVGLVRGVSGAMANRHFGKLADVWKHAVLAAVAGCEPPHRYAETHAGSAAYPLVHDEERRFGILRFLEVAPRSPVLARSRYRTLVAPFIGSGAYRELAELSRVPLWCGDIMTVDADGAGYPGNLGTATTPGTGSGVILANVHPDTIGACSELGRALAEAYRGATLPDGDAGNLVFTTFG